MASTAESKTSDALVELLGSTSVVDHSGKKQLAVDAVRGKPFAIYFSAHWCPPCRQFTPMLSKFYKNCKATGRDFEVIFSSRDKSTGQFQEYFESMPWLAFPFGDSIDKVLGSKFKVQGIPTMVMIDGEGNVITTNGRMHVMTDPEGKDFPWYPKTISQMLEKAPLVNKDGVKSTFKDIKADVLGVFVGTDAALPAKNFNTKLAATYEACKAAGKSFEVVYVSADDEKSGFDAMMADKPWLALPHNDSHIRDIFMEFNIETAPTFLVFDLKTDTCINKKGVPVAADAANYPFAAPACSAFGEGADPNTTPTVVLMVDDAEDVDAADAAVEDFKKVAGEIVAGMSNKDELAFAYVDDENDFVGAIRRLGMTRLAAPALVIIDIPATAKYIWKTDSSFPSADDIKSFVAEYRAGKLHGVHITAPVKSS